MSTDPYLYNAKAKQLETNLHLLPNELDSLLEIGKRNGADAAGCRQSAGG